MTIPPLPPNHPRRRALLPVVMACLVVALAGVQYRWLRQFGELARDRMERDLDAAVTRVAGSLDLALGLAIRGLSGTSGDTAWAELVLDEGTGAISIEMREAPPPSRDVRLLARPVPVGDVPVPLVVSADSTWLVASLLPRLATEIARDAELRPLVALRHLEADGTAERVLAPTATRPAADPDASVRLFDVLSGSGVFLMPRVITRDTVGPQPMTWIQDAGPPAAVPGAARGWTLAAWHEAGSLEAAVAGQLRRQAAGSLGLLLALAAATWLMVTSARRREREAMDRATVLAGISHELRTPLAVIQSAGDNLADGTVTDPEAIREYGAMVTGESRRLLRSANGALALARGGLADQATTGETSLEDLRDDLADTDDPDSRVTWEIEPGLVVPGDRGALGILVRNLIDNALGYSPPGAPVEVVATAAGSAVFLEVRDRGPGLDAGEARRMLAPFVRGSGTSVPGVGLGLALVDRIVRAHGGTLVFLTREDGGTTVRVRLPGRTS